MSENATTQQPAFSQDLCSRLNFAIATTDGDGYTRWCEGFRNIAYSEPSGQFAEWLYHAFEPLPGAPAPCESFRSPKNGRCYRHSVFPEASGESVHYLVDVTAEKELESQLADQFQQLMSMKEIVDTLYQSTRTEEALYLILIAVTSQMGFGFNRAFYLEAIGPQFRGRIGIGPSSIEEAHGIWDRLAQLNLSSLRAVYENMTAQEGEKPDPRTQKIASQLLVAIPEENSGHDSDDALALALASKKPVVMNRGENLGPSDVAILDTLQTDSLAFVPLYARGRLAGVLIADNFITKQRVSTDSLNLLTTFAGYAGIALERSQLYDQLRERGDRLEASNEQLREQQEQLLRAEKLSAVGELAASVSHEIRNPLVAIGGMARSILKNAELTKDHRRRASIIVNEVDQLEKFLRETLDFVKPTHVGAKPVGLIEHTEICLDSIFDLLEAKGIELSFEKPDDEILCLADAQVVQRALRNLLKNAIDVLEPGDRIHVSVSTHDDQVGVLSVADNGPGIAPEHRDRIFEPFFTTKSDGTGLGLAIASHAIRSFGGSISLQEGSEFRTIFSISLPLQEAALNAARRNQGPRRPEHDE